MISQSASPEETEKIASEFSKTIRDLPALIILSGPVGAGKTCFTRGFVRGYLKKDGLVSSPSYSLMNGYKVRKKEVMHVDLYRISSKDDLESIGFWDLFDKKRVVIVEWGEGIFENRPENLFTCLIEISVLDEEKRQIHIKPL